ncbi:MAG: DUF58 domain-containing protein, partial [Chloroflexi bacterium]
MSILARLTLEGLSVKRTLGQTYAHLGDTIELAYELTNDHSLGKLWLEVARVPSEALLLVYPRVVQLPFWTLPGSLLEGNVLTGQRSLQSTSMVMGIREYRPGDAMNRIHWPSSVRHRRLHVKEFELDRTADLWIYLDLDARWHHGDGEDSTEERAVT